MTNPSDWGNVENRLFDDAAYAVPQLHDDQFAQALYDTALFNFDISKSDRQIIMTTLREHMESEYGIEWDNVFDWEGYRENYDRA